MLLNYIIGLIPIMLSFTNSEIDINGIYFNIATILTVALASNFYNASTDKKRKNDSEACDKSKFRLCAAFSVTMLIFITTFSHIKNISSNFFFICICSAVVITSIILAWINYKLTSDYEEKHSDDIGNIAERHVINQDMDEVGATDEW
jgi:undecaprenyl pyrophosphate phosphatase UppP